MKCVRYSFQSSRELEDLAESVAKDFQLNAAISLSHIIPEQKYPPERTWWTLFDRKLGICALRLIDWATLFCQQSQNLIVPAQYSNNSNGVQNCLKWNLCTATITVIATEDTLDWQDRHVNQTASYPFQQAISRLDLPYKIQRTNQNEFDVTKNGDKMDIGVQVQIEPKLSFISRHEFSRQTLVEDWIAAKTMAVKNVSQTSGTSVSAIRGVDWVLCTQNSLKIVSMCLRNINLEFRTWKVQWVSLS